jgi:oligopeptide transport system ATP-binding protein
VSLLEVSGLSKSYPRGRNWLGIARERLQAVDDVSFYVESGETFALVGESGAGKSTTGRLILRLIEPDAGSVRFEGRDILAMSRRDFRPMRQRMQMIFQDAFGSLDPRIPILQSVAEPLLVHFGMRRSERFEHAANLLRRVGLRDHLFGRFPRELSGGQLQRIAIARALTLHPSLIVCDEPVAALDVSVRAQVLNLMKDLQQELGLAYLFVSHDLALVEAIADRVAVMRSGRIVEQGPVDEIFNAPREDYTRSLLDAIPVPVPKALRSTISLKER